MAEEVSKNSPTGERPARRRWELWLAVPVVLTLGFALFPRGSFPPLTRARFDEAKQRWQQHGPANYDIEIRVDGRQKANYAVSVRDGDVTAATRDGSPLTQRRTQDTWSVPGMFDTMRVDLENIEKRTQGKADASTPHVRARVEFDTRLGYPKRFVRIEETKRDGNFEVYWEVTKLSEPAGDMSAEGK